MVWKRWTALLVLSVIALLIKIISFFPGAIERYYSNGFYAWFSPALRVLLGWIPISVGDILYGSVFIFFAFKAVSFFRKRKAGRLAKASAGRIAGKLITFLLALYVVFNIMWGLNYNRQGIADQMQLALSPYSNEELGALLRLLVSQLNGLDSISRENRGVLQKKSVLFSEAVRAYGRYWEQENLMQYRLPSLKPSLYSLLGNYFGFTGYYNPFSGEAQVNTTVPVFIQPFITCHEIGHQLGYAKENEANFAGYLAAMASPDPAFRYSASFELYLYAASELYMRDSVLVRPFRDSLQPAVRADFAELRSFYRKFENPLEPYIRRLYGRYLRANGQPQGIRTYDEVTAWAIAYYRKRGLVGR